LSSLQAAAASCFPQSCKTSIASLKSAGSCSRSQATLCISYRVFSFDSKRHITIQLTACLCLCGMLGLLLLKNLSLTFTFLRVSAVIRGSLLATCRLFRRYCISAFNCPRRPVPLRTLPHCPRGMTHSSSILYPILCLLTAFNNRKLNTPSGCSGPNSTALIR
jgi:hypothetical protein